MTTKKRLAVAVIGGALGAAVLGGTGASVEGCHPTPAEQADVSEMGAVGTRVLVDLLSGMGYEATFADVAKMLAGQPGADVAAIVDDAIQFLIDEGKIPAGVTDAGLDLFAHARSVQAKAHAARRVK